MGFIKLAVVRDSRKERAATAERSEFRRPTAELPRYFSGLSHVAGDYQLGMEQDNDTLAGYASWTCKEQHNTQCSLNWRGIRHKKYQDEHAIQHNVSYNIEGPRTTLFTNATRSSQLESRTEVLIQTLKETCRVFRRLLI